MFDAGFVHHSYKKKVQLFLELPHDFIQFIKQISWNLILDAKKSSIKFPNINLFWFGYSEDVEC